MHCDLIKKTHYINSKDKNASLLLGNHLKKLLDNPDFSCNCPVFICIGSDRVTGDSLGPIIGSSLLKSCLNRFPIYGTLDAPVHALNLSNAVRTVKENHPNHPVIAIDASLGTKRHQGYISVGRGPLLPGAGVEKELPPVGDLFITGIINTTGRFAHLALQTTRLSTVIHLADCIVEGILQALLCCEPDDELDDFLFTESDFIPISSIPALAPTAGATLDAN